MGTLYNIFISLLIFGMKVGSLFNAKLKSGLVGRKESIKKIKEKFNKNDHVIWMHASSLGEYEQGLPVLEKLKADFPNHKTLVTFFSPSGYEIVVKKNKVADVVCYLPFDKKSMVKEFTSNFKTNIFFTVKYDFWYHLLAELRVQGAKTYAISSLFYESQIFFKPYGKWFVNQLRQNIDWFFHQTKHSTELAKEIGLTQSSTAGDTRFDRVKQILHRDNFVKYIAEFKGDEQLIVFGSAWDYEERMAEAVAKKNKSAKIIIAPHDLKRVDGLKIFFPDLLLYSEIKDNDPALRSERALVIDSIGLLSRVYSYADIAVVGGGFHSKGLHNILEPAAFGIPVIFGNHYKKNPEADALIENNGAESFDDEYIAATYITELLHKPELMKEIGKSAGNFVKSQPDATEIILKKILEG